MPECPPWAPRPFARSCVRAAARSSLVPRPTRERAKCPAPTAERRRHFARSCGAGENRAAGGVDGDRLEARGGLPGSPRASRRSPPPRAARVPDERAKHPCPSTGWPWHFARSAGRERAEPRPGRRRRRAGGIPRCVHGVAVAFRPFVVRRRDRRGRRGRQRPPGGAGRPAGVATGLQAVACSARGFVADERAKHPGPSAGRPRHFARSW